MAEQWYVSRGEKRYGPYRREELAQHARSGNVTRTDLVWSESTGDWVRADQVPGLLPTAAAQPTRGKPTQPQANRKKVVALTCGGMAMLLVVGCVTAGLLLGGPGSGVDEAAGVAEDEISFAELEAFHEAMDVGDDSDWQNYPDREAEEAAIAQTLDAFTAALKRGDVDGSVAHVCEERREGYRELFSSNPDAMTSFADVIANSEMSFLSEQGHSQAFNRTAEVAVDLDGFTFYMVLMKVDDRWVLYDF